jgi:hypothetical protein
MSHHMTEAVIVRSYAACIMAECHRVGLPVVVVPELGRYADRHAWVAHHLQDHGIGRAVYLQCHGNAGGGAYGLVEHDARSTRGAAVASSLAAALETGLGALVSGYTARTHGLAEGERGITCIGAMYAIRGVCGLILEPGFIDGAAHGQLWTPAGQTAIARAVVAGLLTGLGGAP